MSHKIIKLTAPSVLGSDDAKENRHVIAIRLDKITQVEPYDGFVQVMNQMPTNEFETPETSKLFVKNGSVVAIEGMNGMSRIVYDNANDIIGIWEKYLQQNG